MKNLDGIFLPVQKGIAAVENVLSREANSKDKFLKEVSRYILESKGKRIRPALALLSYGLNGSHSPAKAVNLAAAIELIHTATLIHDDIIDKALYRRGKETINVKWGTNIAILIGDYIYAASSRLLSDLKAPAILSYLANVTNKICEGEIRQLRMVCKKKISEKEYLRIIERKTANLMAASCKTGAILAKAKKSHIKRFEGFGFNFGMAFQIIDDCKDIVGDEIKEGKTLGTDLKEGKFTLPLIYLEEVSKNNLEKGKQKAVRKAMGKARNYITEAKKELSVLEDSVFKRSLFDLADYIIK